MAFGYSIFFYLRKSGFPYNTPRIGGQGGRSGEAAGAKRPPSGGAKGSGARAAEQANKGKERTQARTPAAPAAPHGGASPPKAGGKGEEKENGIGNKKQGEGELPRPPERDFKKGSAVLRTDWIEHDDMRLVMRLLTPANALAAEVALRTGLRISDVLSIKKEQLEKGCRFTVREQKTKKSRRVYLGENLRERLLQQSGEVYVFEHALDSTRHRTRQAVFKDLKRAAKALRIDANFAPHSMRKIYAVDYFRKHGLEATQKILGHHYPSTTLIYLLSELAK